MYELTLPLGTSFQVLQEPAVETTEAARAKLDEVPSLVFQIFHEYLKSMGEPTSIPEGMKLRVLFTEWVVLYASVCDDLEHMRYDVDGEAYRKKRAKDVKSDETWNPRKDSVTYGILKMYPAAQQTNEAHKIIEHARYAEYQASAEGKRKMTEHEARYEADVSPGRVGSGSRDLDL